MNVSAFEKMLDLLLDLTWDSFSEQTIKRTKWVIIDTAVTAWAGVRSREIEKFLSMVGSESPTEYKSMPILGTRFYTTVYDSLMVLGTSIVCNELDEGNQYAKGHSAAHVFGPAYVAAIENDVSGRELIRAFAIGYEAGARLGYASGMKDEMHPHGTWGIVGGTVAAGILQKKSKEEIIRAAVLAASVPLSTSWEAAVEGMTVRNLYTGLAGVHSYLCLQLQAAGFQSNTRVVEHLWGSIMSERFKADLLLENLWSPPLIEKNYFKLYPACRFAHTAVDAAEKLMQRSPIPIGEIESVEVDTYDLAARLRDQEPRNSLAAKFSIPFLIAAIMHGYSLFESFMEPVFNDPAIRRLAKLVTVREDPSMTAMQPRRVARVNVRLKDGTSRSSFVDAASGGPELPFPEERMRLKIRRLLQDDLKPDQVDSVIADGLCLEQFPSVRDWLANFLGRQKQS